MALEERLKTEAERTGFGLARLRGDEGAAIEDIAATQRLRLDDFFTFMASRTDAFDEVDEFQTIRFRVRAELAERVFEQFVVDIGFEKPVTLKPDRVRTSDFLSFAGIEPLELPAIPLAQHLAEKIHAYTRSYGPTARPSTRPKDLIDILLIADSQTLEAVALRDALRHTFEGRGRQTLPRSLPPPPPEWAPSYGLLAKEVGLEPDLAAAFDHAAAFLDPVLSGEAHGNWDAAVNTWAPGDTL